MMAVRSTDNTRRAPDRRDPITVLREEKLITARDIASALTTLGRPWTVRQATRWLQKSGVAFQLVERKNKRAHGQRGGAWYTTRALLRERFPSVLELIDQDRIDRVERDDDMDDDAS
jgi:hypothetical protein